MKIGVIIRSVGERTAQLCYDAVAQTMPDTSISIVENHYPFSSAIYRMVEIAEHAKYDWYLGLDADVILCPTWLDIAQHYMSDKYYRIDFIGIDRFIGQAPVGAHLYNGRFNAKIRKALGQTENTTKPEGNIRHIIDVPQHQPTVLIGHHGFEQYRRDIFARFALRAVRNPEYVKKHGLFSGKLCVEESIAKSGWDYGLLHPVEAQAFLDARNKLHYKHEFPPLSMSLKEFYLTNRL